MRGLRGLRDGVRWSEGSFLLPDLRHVSTAWSILFPRSGAANCTHWHTLPITVLQSPIAVTAEVMEARDGSGAKAESELVEELPPAAGGLELTLLHSKAARARGPWDREGIRQAML